MPSKLRIPCRFVPDKAFAAVGVVAAGHADFIAVVNAGHAGKEKEKAQRQLQPLPVAPQQGEKAIGVMGIKQVHHHPGGY